MHSDHPLWQAKWAGRLEERERISRELHDTLLQSAQGLILRLQSVAGPLSPHDPVRQQIESALDQAGDLLGETRACVRNLRSLNGISDLSRAIQQKGMQFSSETAVAFVFGLQGELRPVQPRVAGELYAIAREAITNSFRHARATTVRADLLVDSTWLLLRVTDDGNGYEAGGAVETVEHVHFGIRGMRERAQELGAQIVISSSRGMGTEVECAVPASAAYEGTLGDAWLPGSDRQWPIGNRSPKANALANLRSRLAAAMPRHSDSCECRAEMVP
jgi:signal transduction histidine kinase